MLLLLTALPLMLGLKQSHHTGVACPLQNLVLNIKQIRALEKLVHRYESEGPRKKTYMEKIVIILHHENSGFDFKFVVGGCDFTLPRHMDLNGAISRGSY